MSREIVRMLSDLVEGRSSGLMLVMYDGDNGVEETIKRPFSNITQCLSSVMISEYFIP